MTGKRIKTNLRSGASFTGCFVAHQYFDNRKDDAVGTARGFVAGHGGDLWWVEHPDGDVAVYFTDELEEAAMNEKNLRLQCLEIATKHLGGERAIKLAEKMYQFIIGFPDKENPDLQILNLIKEHFKNYPDFYPSMPAPHWFRRAQSAEDILAKIRVMLMEEE